METEVFLQGLRRFVSRRGTPSLLVSDNAQTFKSAKHVLLFIYEHESVQRYLSYKQIEWKFILSKSRFYERMIQLVKRMLRKVLGNARLTYDELYTILVEVECTVNSRPLTYVSTDELEVEPLTPSHLLCGHRIQSLPEVILDNDGSFNDKEILTQRMKYINC